MQNLLQFSESIKREGKFYLPLAGATISMVDVRDIAAVAVASLTSDTHVGKTYEITGPCAIGFEEVAAELELVLGRDIEFVAIPDASFKEGLLSFGLSEWFADALIQLFVGARNGAQAHVSEAVLQATGQAPRPLAQFLRDHAKSFA